MKQEIEIWKDILCYDGIFKGHYEISSLGRVRNKDGQIKQVGRNGRSKYPTVNLYLNGKNHTAYIHILVACAFVPNPYKKPCVDHINAYTTDYRIENLRWVTHKENLNNPITKKKVNEVTHSPEIIAKAFETRKRNKTKRTPITLHQFTLDGKHVATYASLIDAERNTCINFKNIAEALKGRRQSVGGYLWSQSIIPPKYNPYKVKRKRVAQYDMEMKLIKEWDSITEAAFAIGVDKTNISAAICGRNKRKSCGGYKWKLIE